MNIQGLNKLTLMDFPHKLACIVFTGGCNFRCPFCQNGSLVVEPSTKPAYSPEDILDFLSHRKGILEGVCISGGEPTLHPDLIPFIYNIKKMGFAVKIDTNGTNPDMIDTLINDKLLDYVAMDIKNSPTHYPQTAGLYSVKMDNIKNCASLLMSNKIDYEFRTTVVHELHCDDDFHEIGKWLRGAKRYFLQSFRLSDGVIDKALTTPLDEDMERYKSILSQYIQDVEIRK